MAAFRFVAWFLNYFIYRVPLLNILQDIIYIYIYIYIYIQFQMMEILGEMTYTAEVELFSSILFTAMSLGPNLCLDSLLMFDVC
jgi:hypothetical protein